MEPRRIDTVLFQALYLIGAGIVVTQVLDWDRLTSVLFGLTFPLTVLLWLRSVRETVTGGDLLALGTAALAALHVLLNATAGGAEVGFSYLKKGVMFIMSLLFLQTARRTRLSEALEKFLHNTADGLAVFLIGMYFWKTPQMYSLNGRDSVYLTFRFTNPNLTGLFLVCLYMLELTWLLRRERRARRVLGLILAGFLGAFTVLTQSRNCLLALVAFTAAWLWVLLRGRRELRFRRGWAALTAACPGVFVAGYLALVSVPWIQRAFSFLTGEGKGLDSRVTIWKNALGYLRESPVTGAYFEISHGAGVFQLHNTHLDVAASYGVPVLILVCVLLAGCLYQGGRAYRGRDRCAAILGFACAILLGTGEAALVSGGLGIYIWMTALLPVFFGKSYSPMQLKTARWLLVIFTGATGLRILDDAFRGCVLGRERFYFLYGGTTVRYLLRFGAIFLLTRLAEVSAVDVALADLYLYGLSLAADILYCRLRLKERLRLHSVRKQELAAIASFSVAVLLQTAVNLVNTHVDTVILGAMLPDKRIVTMYSCALSIFAVYQTLICGLTGVYLPEAARLVAEERSGEELTDFVIRPGRLQAVIAVAVLGAFGLFGRRFLRLWIGERYQQAYFVALALMLAATVPLVQNVCLTLLNAKLKQLFRSGVLMAVAALNVVVSIGLVQRIGYWGAALGTVLALLLGNGLAMNLYYARVLRLNVGRMLREIFSGILPAGLVGCLFSAPLVWLPGDTVRNLAAGCLGFALAYGCALWRFGLNPEEKKRLLARRSRGENQEQQ